MNSIGKCLAVFPLALGLALPVAAWAQMGGVDATVISHQAGQLAEGEIRRINLETGKLTIRHGEIKSLDMPPMTMVFTVTDQGLLAGLKVGDRIRFAAVHEGGQYGVTDIQRVP